MTGQWELDKNQAILALQNSLASSSYAAGGVGDAAVRVPGRRTIIGLQSPVELYRGEPAAPRKGNACSAASTASLKWASLPSNRPAAGTVAVRSIMTAELAPSVQHDCSSVTPGDGHQQLQEPMLNSGTVIRRGTVTCDCTGSSSSRPCSTLLHQQFERDRNMAVLAMEKRLIQLNQDLTDSKEAQAKYQEQLQEAVAMHKHKLQEQEVRP